jgi:aspartate carbamoyltransferase regulatory subunit
MVKGRNLILVLVSAYSIIIEDNATKVATIESSEQGTVIDHIIKSNDWMKWPRIQMLEKRQQNEARSFFTM